jgi:hypothetical protein
MRKQSDFCAAQNRERDEAVVQRIWLDPAQEKNPATRILHLKKRDSKHEERDLQL